MKNICIKKHEPAHRGENLQERIERNIKTIEEASRCLLLIYNDSGELVGAHKEGDAFESLAWCLYNGKMNKNGTRIRRAGMDYENGAEILRVSFPNCSTVYEFRLRVW